MPSTGDNGMVRLSSGDGGHIGDLPRVGGGDVVNGDGALTNHLVGGFIVDYCHTRGKNIINEMFSDWFMMPIITS